MSDVRSTPCHLVAVKSDFILKFTDQRTMEHPHKEMQRTHLKTHGCRRRHDTLVTLTCLDGQFYRVRVMFPVMVRVWFWVMFRVRVRKGKRENQGLIHGIHQSLLGGRRTTELPTEEQTDRQTDRPRDTPSYRVP